ncbi:DUF4013 domain-containing protein [Methanobrevibacter sp.]|uniref:DUF4013 domain-containing protein n=1 Tax=Methanobrevibacter sp. TaxID=66852 RepID=UPI0025F1A5E6|nr:DUF4013 domain-containing protein [Methanobrevibacter sp.]MBQ2831236.1 DUF4013 domain-containing protein [Methanobrevibacter sp.]
MEIGEIFSDAFMYPLKNIKALVIYAILGIIVGIASAGSIAGMNAGMSANNLLAVIGSGIIGIIISLLIGFVIEGYLLDVIKFGITRDDAAPEIDLIRQSINGVKLFIITLVYYLIPIIISALLAIFLANWLSSLIAAILFIIFAFAAFMGQCRLAKTEDLMYSLNIAGALADITKIGIVKIIIFTIVVFIAALVLSLIGTAISQLNAVVGGIIMGIIGIYLTFAIARASGLLYSSV